jgi:hypothetical protein
VELADRRLSVTAAPWIKSYRELLELLAHDGVMHQGDAAARLVRIPTERDGLEGVQLIRWQDQDGVVQFIQSMIADVPEERIGAVEGAVARLNHVLAWPGIDLNHTGRLLAYRIALPLRPRGGVEPREVRTCFTTAVRAAALLVPSFQRVLAGAVAAADVVEDVRRTLAAATTPGAPPIVFDID